MNKLIFLFAMVFAVSMAMGQNTKTMNQSGGNSNSDYSIQTGDLNVIYIKQALANPTGSNTAGTDASDHIIQNGLGNIANLSQTVALTSAATQSNLAKIEQVGSYNKLIGATSAGFLNGDNTFAVQIANYYTNDLNIKQWGGNRNAIGLYQNSKFENDFGTVGASIEQKGFRNELVVYQSTSAGGTYVTASSEQIGDDNVARVMQTAGGGHQRLTLKQYGDDNEVVGADASGTIVHGGVATQNTGSAWGGRSNTMDIYQSGGKNWVGLFQSSTNMDNSFNKADIDQTGGSNKLGAYQLTTAGNSDLFVTQTGGDVATIVQTSAGNNISTTIQ
jgi:hypothetical protein